MVGSKKSLAMAVALAAVAGVATAAPAPAPTSGPGAAPWPPQPSVAGGKYVMKDGAAIFHNVCANCHMQDGKGVLTGGAGIYPALASNPKLASAAYPIMVVVHGQKGMPHFGELLSDDQVAAVVGYIRTNLGNRFTDPVTADEVKAMR